VNRSVPVAACVLLVGCASALKEPPALHDLAPPSETSSVTDVDALLARADRLHGERTLESARAASGLYLRAAGADEDRIEALIGAVRAQVWIANHEDDAEARERAAVAGVHAAQWCRRIRPAEAACQYWLAVALGVQARERRATGLDAMPRMVELLESAAVQDPELERAGPHRVLALVLLRAPGWPSGPGDPERGLEQARLAIDLFPDFAPNQLCLGEALEAAGETRRSREAYELAATLARPLAEAGDFDAREWLEEAELVISGGESPGGSEHVNGGEPRKAARRDVNYGRQRAAGEE
jgi:tetratricopeptide (TPR) repeat protein